MNECECARSGTSESEHRATGGFERRRTHLPDFAPVALNHKDVLQVIVAAHAPRDGLLIVIGHVLSMGRTRARGARSLVNARHGVVRELVGRKAGQNSSPEPQIFLKDSPVDLHARL